MNAQRDNLSAEPSSDASADVVGFTPGPWRAWNNSHYWQIESDDGQIGDACASFFIREDGAPENWPLAEANARLIAASPDAYKLADYIERTAGIEELSDGVEVTFSAAAAAVILRMAQGYLKKARGQ